MPPKKKQHYVPRSYLNYFATPSSRLKQNKAKWRINVHDKDANTTTPKPRLINDVAQESWFYELKDEEKFLEDSFDGIETKAGEIFKRIDETKDISWITDLDKRNLAKFLAVQYIRGPKHRHFNYKTLIKPFLPDFQLDAKQAHHVAIRELSPIVYELIMGQEKWQLIENLTDTPLLTSDSPAYLMPLETPDISHPPSKLRYIRATLGFVDFANDNPGDYPPLGVGMPLSSSLLLAVGPEGLRVSQGRQMDEEEVRKTNVLHIVQSYEQLYASKFDSKSMAHAKDMSRYFYAQLKGLTG